MGLYLRRGWDGMGMGDGKGVIFGQGSLAFLAGIEYYEDITVDIIDSEEGD